MPVAAPDMSALWPRPASEGIVSVYADDRTRLQNNACTLFYHRIDDSLRGMEDPSKIDIDNVVKLLQRHLLQAGVSRYPCVVLQDVDSPIFVEHVGTMPSTISIPHRD